MRKIYFAAIFVGLLINPVANADGLTFYFQDLHELRAIDVNNSGHIIGRRAGKNYLIGAGADIDLGEFSPTAINNNDQILGTMADGRPAIWTSGVLNLIPTQYPSNSSYSFYSLNDSGTAVGFSYDGQSLKAIRYENGVTTTIGRGAAFSINNSGTIVGTNNLDDGGSSGIIWEN